MTMRSMPPASSHLAERPVPAPPPTIGWPRAIMSRNRVRISWREMRGIGSASLQPAHRRGEGGDLAERGDHGLGEGGIVDVVRHADQLALATAAEIAGDRVEEGLVGERIPEGLSRRIDRREPALRQE